MTQQDTAIFGFWRMTRTGWVGGDVVAGLHVPSDAIEVLFNDLLPSRESIAPAHGEIMADLRSHGPQPVRSWRKSAPSRSVRVRVDLPVHPP